MDHKCSLTCLQKPTIYPYRYTEAHNPKTSIYLFYYFYIILISMYMHFKLCLAVFPATSICSFPLSSTGALCRFSPILLLFHHPKFLGDRIPETLNNAVFLQFSDTFSPAATHLHHHTTLKHHHPIFSFCLSERPNLHPQKITENHTHTHIWVFIFLDIILEGKRFLTG